MQYRISDKGLAPNKDELNAIEAKIGLSLSRFTHLITKCEIIFENKHTQDAKTLITCCITVNMANNIEFVISDTASSINEAFPMALGRIKRNIERHLKRHHAKRSGASLGSRSL
jgi:ribosome-associated translation inhibitor RaiA